MGKSFYEGKIKVVGCDLMCFAADPVTLEALTVSYYDAYAWMAPEEGPVETIHVNEWDRRLNERRLNKRRAWADAQAPRRPAPGRERGNDA